MMPVLTRTVAESVKIRGLDRSWICKNSGRRRATMISLTADIFSIDGRKIIHRPYGEVPFTLSAVSVQ